MGGAKAIMWTHRIRKHQPCRNTGEEHPGRRTACAKAQGQERAVCERNRLGIYLCRNRVGYERMAGAGLVMWTPRPG